MRRAFVATAAVAVALLAVAGCGGDDDVAEPITPAEFEAGLIAREQISPETASCVSAYLLGNFSDADMRQLAAEVPEAVPPQVWGRYTQVLLACQYHDELGVTAAPSGS